MGAVSSPDKQPLWRRSVSSPFLSWTACQRPLVLLKNRSLFSAKTAVQQGYRKAVVPWRAQGQGVAGWGWGGLRRGHPPGQSLQSQASSGRTSSPLLHGGPRPASSPPTLFRFLLGQNEGVSYVATRLQNHACATLSSRTQMPGSHLHALLTKADTPLIPSQSCHLVRRVV